jgi:DNA-binding transcriptional regulator YiaG
MQSLIEEVRAMRALPDAVTATRIRRAAGVSRQRMADELGVHEVTFARWERGESNPTGPRRIRYAQLLQALALEVA